MPKSARHTAAIHKGKYDIGSIFRVDGGIYGRYNPQALVAYALEMVEAGLGWGNFPQSVVASLLAAGRLRRLNFKNIENGLAMVVNAVWLKNQPLHRGASALVKMLASAD